MNRWILVGTVYCIAGTSLAFGADSAWYVGASLGQVKSHYSSKDANSLGYDAGYRLDNSDTGAKLFGGYSFTSNWGAEFGYVDLGTATFSGTSSGAANQDQFSAKGVVLSAIGTWPLGNDFSVLGKLGAITAKTQYNCVQNCAAIQSNEKTGVYAALGIGAQYKITNNVSLRTEYERFNGVKSEATGAGASAGASASWKSNYDLLSLGVVYKF